MAKSAKSDRYAALFFLAVAAYVCHQALAIGVGSLRQPGPGLLSFGAGMAVGLLSLAVLIGTLWKGKAIGSEPAEGGEQDGRRARVAVICISLFLYTIAVVWLGFVLATLLFVLFLFRVVESEGWGRSAVKAILVTLGNYLVFVVWLGVKLPQGLLPW